MPSKRLEIVFIDFQSLKVLVIIETLSGFLFFDSKNNETSPEGENPRQSVG